MSDYGRASEHAEQKQAEFFRSDTRVSVSNTRSYVSITHMVVSGTCVAVSHTRVSVSNTRMSVFGTRESVSDTRVYVSNTRVGETLALFYYSLSLSGTRSLLACVRLTRGC